jgi:hypothetical protein
MTVLYCYSFLKNKDFMYVTVEINKVNVRFQVLTAASMKITAF